MSGRRNGTHKPMRQVVLSAGLLFALAWLVCKQQSLPATDVPEPDDTLPRAAEITRERQEKEKTFGPETTVSGRTGLSISARRNCWNASQPESPDFV